MNGFLSLFDLLVRVLVIPKAFQTSMEGNGVLFLWTPNIEFLSILEVELDDGDDRKALSKALEERRAILERVKHLFAILFCFLKPILRSEKRGRISMNVRRGEGKEGIVRSSRQCAKAAKGRRARG